MPATTLADRAVIRLSGDDPRGFLQGLVTNDVSGALPVWAGLLTPQGKTLFDFLVWEAGGDLLIDCEAAAADAIVKRLSIYRLRRKLDITRATDLAVHWSREPARGVPDPRDTALGHRWIAPPDEPASGWHTHRLAHGIVEGIEELGDGTTLWLECRAREQNGVSFTKGCFVGQENTARMHHRQKVNRMVSVVTLADAAADEVRASWPELGLAVVHRRIAS